MLTYVKRAMEDGRMATCIFVSVVVGLSRDEDGYWVQVDVVEGGVCV